MEVFQFFGRLHPLILHLPIGFLILAFILEWTGRVEKYKVLQPAVGFSLKLGMWSAIFAAISGYILSLEGDYNEQLLDRHQWLGIATAIGAILVYVLYKGARPNRRTKVSAAFVPGALLEVGRPYRCCLRWRNPDNVRLLITDFKGRMFPSYVTNSLLANITF